MKRWAIRIGLAILALALLGSGVVARAYLQWHAKALALFPSASSTVVTTTRGPVEYAELGRGRPVLQVHGSPGGFDSFYVLDRMQYGESGPPFRAILPSRPGYLRTPLSTGRTPAEQADAMAALLDVLQVKRVAVIGLSDGGPSSLQFALRHGDRCSALILISAVAQKIPDDTDLPPVLALMDKVLPKDFMPYAFQKSFAGNQLKNANDPEGLAMVDRLFLAMVPYAPREAGLWNDAAQDKQIKDWPLRDIRCPTLIVHGTTDDMVPLAHGETAASQIPGAQMVRLEGADHFAFITRRKEIDAAVAGFLAQHPDPDAR